jgi:hypothetical protein
MVFVLVTQKGQGQMHVCEVVVQARDIITGWWLH